jgi:membrane fusion protein (multidrug efflux system)
MNKKVKFIIYSIIALVIILLLVLPKFTNSEANVQQADGRNQLPNIQVKAHILSFETLKNKVITSGTVLAEEEVELKSEVAGKITKIAFKEGSSVSRGELLVKINDAELQAQLNRTKYRLKLLEDKEFRQRRLLEREAISQEDYDVSLNELNMLKAEIDLINAQIAKTEIRATYNGVVGLKNISEGSIVSTTTVIAVFQSINTLKIDFSIPEKYAADVKVGDIVKFKVEGTDEIKTAKVSAIEPKIDPITRTLPIRAVYANLKRDVFPGAFASVELVLHEINNALLVPTHSIIPELKGQKVYLYKSGRVAEFPVQTGIRTDTHVQITEGLNVNDTLITSGILQIRSGLPVGISEFN